MYPPPPLRKTRLTEEEKKYNESVYDHSTDEPIAVSLIRNTDGSSQYLHVSLSTKEGKAAQVTAECDLIPGLRDTGATRSCVAQSLVDSTPGLNNVPITPSNRRIRDASNQVQPVLGTIPLYMTFYSAKKFPITIKHRFYVIRNLSSPLIIGSDIIRGYETVATDDFSYISNNKKSIDDQDSNLTFAQLTSNCVKIPISRTPLPTRHRPPILTCTFTVVPPRSSKTVPCTLANAKYTDILTDRMVSIQKHPRAHPQLHILESYAILPGDQKLDLPVFNKTDFPITLERNVPVARAQGLIPVQYDDNISAVQEVDFHPEEWEQQDDLDSKAFDQLLDKAGISDEEERTSLKREYASNGSIDLPANTKGTRGLPAFDSSSEPPRTDDELIDAVNLSHLTPERQEIIRAVLRKNIAVFQRHKHHYSESNTIEATVDLKPIPQPVRQASIPTPPQLRPQVDRVLQALLDSGVISKAEEATPVISSLLIIPKANKKDIRVLVDLRHLNALTIRRQTDAIHLDEVQAQFSNAKYVTTIDVSNAFFSVPIAKKHRRLMAFVAPNKQIYVFNRLIQGWANSPYFLNQLMFKAIGHLPDVSAYVDDIFHTHGLSFEDHVDMIDTILQALIAHGLVVKPEKLMLATKHVQYLGMVFNIDTNSQGTVSIPKARIQGYLAMEKPKTKKALLSFLCSIAYFRRMIPRFSQLTFRLHRAAMPTAPKLVWTPQLDDDYKYVLDQIQVHGTIACPDPNKPFICFSDASSAAASFMVFQKADDKDSPLKLCACMSRSFSKSEQSTHIFQKELLAVTYGLESYQYFLRFAKNVTVFTDARGISLARMARNASPALMRRLLFICSFNVTLRYIEGKNNIMSDFLSRYHNREPADKPHVKYLTAKDAARLLEAVKFNDITITPEEVQAWLNQAPPIPAPANKQRAPAKPKNRAPLPAAALTPTTHPNPKRKLPKMYVNRAYPGHPDDSVNTDPVINSKAPKHVAEPSPLPETPITAADEAYFKALEHGKASKPLEWLDNIQQTLDHPIEVNHLSFTDAEPLPDDPPYHIHVAQRISAVHDEPRLLDFKRPQDPEVTNAEPHFLANTNPIEFSMTPTEPQFSIFPDEESQHKTEDVTPLQDDNDQDPSKDVLADTSSQTVPVTSPEDTEYCCDHARADFDCEHRLTPSTHKVISRIPMDGHLTAAQFASCQRSDPDIAPHFDNLGATFSNIAGVIHKIVRHTPRPKPYIPTSLLKHQIQLYHYSIWGVHRPTHTIFETLKLHFYHPQMLDIIKKEIDPCAICTVCKRAHWPKPAQGSFATQAEPRRAYAFDLAPNLPSTSRGNNHALVIVDLCSLLTRVYPIKKKQAPDLIAAFKNLMIADATQISYLRSDGEKGADSDEFKEFCLTHHIKHEKTAQNSPQANGVAEVAIRHLKDSLKYLSRMCPDEWDNLLHFVVLSHARVVAKHGATPEKLHFGSESPSPFTLLNFKPDMSAEDIKDFREKLYQDRKRAHDAIVARKSERKDYKSCFSPGQTVLVLQSQPSKDKTFQCRYTGPYIITAIQNNSSTCELKALNSNVTRKVQMVHLKPLPAAGTQPLTPAVTTAP